MKRALLIDDNQLVEKIARMYLERYGWQVEYCNGPFGVLKKVREFQPDIVLLDLNMPGLSGNSLAGLLKEHKHDHGFCVIAFSSEPENIQKDLVRAGLVDGYFVKNQSLEGLEEVMEWVAAKKCLANVGNSEAV